MITLYPIDGLGNQMFQYAFARSLQLKIGTELSINTEMFRVCNNSRKYSLYNLAVPQNVLIKSGILALLKCFIVSNFELKPFSVYNYLHNSNRRYYGKKLIYTQVDDVYSYSNLELFNFSKCIAVFGQFQNYRWFDEYSDIIKKELKVAAPQNKKNQEINKDIHNCNSVCVHIRRGDYLDSNWSHLNVCDYNYYKKSMKFIADNTDSPVFYVFSNTHEEIEWIKQNYDFSEYNVNYIDLDNPDYEELRLMYSCKHFIISNSTFSWWAQYLSDNKEKIVCAPSEWNRLANNESKNIYMNTWHVF